MGVTPQGSRARACVAVVGSSTGTREELDRAEAIGRVIAREGWILVCGGLGGVMDAAARGVEAAGGVAIGILPGDDRSAGSSHLTAGVATGLGEARNVLIVRTADVIVAVGGEFGTLSEIALALKIGKPVIGLDTWSLRRDGLDHDPIVRVASPEDVVAAAREALRMREP
jgi:uncharacterized protein (TIGR00725 family)